MAKKARLGRGLSTLMASDRPAPIETPVASKRLSDPVTPSAAPTDGNDVVASEGLITISIDQIAPNPYQPRRAFDEAALGELAASLKSSGMIQPVVVRAATVEPGDGKADGARAGRGGVTGARRYELIAGERRWRAARLAGLATIPAILRVVDDRGSAEWALIENLQREDLNPIERARSFHGLVRRFGLTQQEVASKLGLDRSSVSNHLRLLELEESLQDRIVSGELSAGHGKALLSAPEGAAREALGERAVDESWSVRRLETEAKRLAEGGSVAADDRPAGGGSGSGGGGGESPGVDRSTLTDLERQLSEQLGTKVALKTSGRGDRGRIEIAFYGLDHFDGLLARLGVRVS